MGQIHAHDPVISAPDRIRPRWCRAAGGNPLLAAAAWVSVTRLVLLFLLFSIAQSLRRGEPGVDVIAALAMAGVLLLGEYLAGAVIAWMLLATGRALEDYADARVRWELPALLERTPPFAHRCNGTERL